MIQSLQAAQTTTMDGHKLIDPQTNIIRYLYRFRFLSSIQLSKLLNQTIRYTNYHLKVLSDKNFISRHYTRSLGLSNLPAVYFLALKSIKALKGQKNVDARGLKHIYREKIRSLKFIAHSGFIADYYLFLLNDSIKTKQTLFFFTKSDLLVHPYIIEPLPDAYFARVNSKGKTKRYFLEVIEAGTPRFALRKRVRLYNDYIEEGTFEEITNHPFPTILFICPSKGTLIYLKKHFKSIYAETSMDRVLVYLATRENAFAGQWAGVSYEED